MNKLSIIAAFIVVFVSLNSNASAQAFRRGSLLISVSEGSTTVDYRTTDMNPGSDVLHNEHVTGTRDPFTIEYGISDRWGIGLTSGADFYNLDPSSFYGFQSANKIKAYMTEFTVDGSYHFYVTKKLDLSAFAAAGFSSVYFKGNTGDRAYNYQAGGLIARTGIKARYYVWHGLGIIGMLTAFTDNCSTSGVKGNTVGDGYTTTIKGAAIEFGLCYRINFIRLK